MSDQVAGTFLERAEIVAVDAPAGQRPDRAARGARPPGRRHPDGGRSRPAPALGGPVVRRPRRGDGRHRHADRRPVRRRRRGRDRAVQRRRAARPGPGPAEPPRPDRPRPAPGGGWPSTWPGSATTESGAVSAGPARPVAPDRQGRRLPHRARVLDHDVSRRGAYLAYIGSGEYPVRVRVLGAGASIPPGGARAIRLWLPGRRCRCCRATATCCVSPGGAETVGGGEILDVSPVLAAAHAAPDRSVAPGGRRAGLGGARPS